MNIKIISIAAFATEEELQELNSFLSSNQIISVEKHFVSKPEIDFWTFCIKYVAQKTGNSKKTKKTSGIDYRELLDDETFAKFDKMRIKRKELAEKENIPAYFIFTNEELSKLAELDKITKEAMLSVKGIGEAKVEKYFSEFENIF